jgi:hypothetical protein
MPCPKTYNRIYNRQKTQQPPNAAFGSAVPPKTSRRLSVKKGKRTLHVDWLTRWSGVLTTVLVDPFSCRSTSVTPRYDLRGRVRSARMSRLNDDICKKCWLGEGYIRGQWFTASGEGMNHGSGTGS